MRLFASAAASEYTSIEQEKFFTPKSPPSFTNKSLTIFNGEDTAERKFVPWVIKDATIKNTLFMTVNYFSYVIFNLGTANNLVAFAIAVNYSKTVWSYMSNAVTKIDLMDDGKSVTLHFGKLGKSSIVPIKDIMK